MVSFPRHHLWGDVHAALRMIGRPLIKIIGPNEHWRDKEHAWARAGLSPPASACPGFNFIFSCLFLFFFLSVEAHFKHKP